MQRKQLLIVAPVFVGQEDILAIVAAMGDVMRYIYRHHPRLTGRRFLTEHRKMSTEQHQFIRHVPLKSWRDFKSNVDDHLLQWIYRRQAKANWNLASSLERSKLLEEFGYAIEQRLIAEYRRAIGSFPEYAPKPVTTLQWLALLQH